MMHDKNSIDYQLNRHSLREMEEDVPMTLRERNAIRNWVRKGHDPESNPWELLDSDGYHLNFLQAFRLEYGYSSGPWDYWRGPEYQTYWCDVRRTFLPKDEL